MGGCGTSKIKLQSTKFGYREMEELGDNTPAIQRHSLASPNKFRAENYRDFRAGRQKERARARPRSTKLVWPCTAARMP